MYESKKTYFLDEAKLKADERTEFGIPSLKKYPMPDRGHVMAAIRMFNHVDSAHEKELATNIKKKMKFYNISPEVVGEKNRLSKYIHEDMDILNEEYIRLDPNDPTKNLTMLQKLEYYITIKPAEWLSNLAHKLNMWMARIKDKYENKKPEERSLWDKVKNMIATLLEKISRKLYNWSTPYLLNNIPKYTPNDKNRSEPNSLVRLQKNIKDSFDTAVRDYAKDGNSSHFRAHANRIKNMTTESCQYNLSNLHLAING